MKRTPGTIRALSLDSKIRFIINIYIHLAKGLAYVKYFDIIGILLNVAEKII